MSLFPSKSLSDDETSMEASQKSKSRLLSLHLQKYRDKYPKSYPGLQSLLIPMDDSIKVNKSSTLEDIIGGLEEDFIDSEDNNDVERGPRVRALSCGENMGTMVNFNEFYESIKRQKSQVFNDFLLVFSLFFIHF